MSLLLCIEREVHNVYRLNNWIPVGISPTREKLLLLLLLMMMICADVDTDNECKWEMHFMLFNSPAAPTWECLAGWTFSHLWCFTFHLKAHEPKATSWPSSSRRKPGHLQREKPKCQTSSAQSRSSKYSKRSESERWWKRRRNSKFSKMEGELARDRMRNQA